jgi:hypothetical protein
MAIDLDEVVTVTDQTVEVFGLLRATRETMRHFDEEPVPSKYRHRAAEYRREYYQRLKTLNAEAFEEAAELILLIETQIDGE